MESVKPCCNSKDSTPPQNKRALVINTQKWNSILKSINPEEDPQLIEERNYKEYLKNGSRELTSHWKNSIEKTRENAQKERQKKEQEKLTQLERRYNEIKENDERIRKEQVAKAQQMIQRMKMGTSELESAAILSEVLKGREIQINLANEMSKNYQKRKSKENDSSNMQNTQWIEDQQKKMLEDRKRNESYKNDLLKMVKDEERRKIEHNKKQNEYEKRLREQADRELKAQIDRERALLQRKKEAMRKNALEAMKMVEQRRLRDKIENEIDNKIIDIFTKGRHNLTIAQKEKERQRIEEAVKLKEANARKAFVAKADTQAAEDERINKAVQELNEKSEAQEKERIQRERNMKAARIKQYIEDMEKQKIAKAKQIEHMRWTIANRLKNEEINQDFEMMRTQEKYKQQQEFRAVILKQIEEKQEVQKLKEIENSCVIEGDSDDKHFMEYANLLIEDAKKKCRPILPLLKVVEKYKKIHEMGAPRKQPAHLKSNIPICDGDEAKSTTSSQNIIKYDLNELKRLNPRISPRPSPPVLSV